MPFFVRVLLIDDSTEIRMRLVDMLRALPEVGDIVEAGSSEEAEDAFRGDAFDAVILDLRLPDGSGLHLLRSFKQSAPDCPVAVLTNYPYPQYRRSCERAGADAFFDKSEQFERVLAWVQSLRGGPERRPGGGPREH